MEPDSRLAYPGRPHDHGRGSQWNAAAHHGIEPGDAGRGASASGRRLAAWARKHRLDPRIDDNARIGNFVGMTPAQVATAAKLRDLKVALGSPAIDSVTECDQAVDHGLLRRNLTIDVGGQEHSAIGRQGDLLQVVDEQLERLFVRRACRGGDKPVDHQHRYPMPLNFLAQELGEFRQAALLHLVEAAQ